MEFSVIDDTNLEDFEDLPNRAIIQIRIPMLCPECDDIHWVSVTALALPKEGGVRAIIAEVQGRLLQTGFRVPGELDFARWAENARAEMEAEAAEREAAEQAQETAKKRGNAVYLHRVGRPGGDA